MTPSEVRGLSRRPGGVRNLGSKSPRPRDPGWARKRRWNNKPQVMHATRRFHGVSGVHMGAILQDLLTLALPSLWKLIAGLAGSSCRSRAVVLTAFCSSPVSRARLPVKVSVMRNSIVAPVTVIPSSRADPIVSPSPSPDRKHTNTRVKLIDADDGALVQRGAVVSKHPHDVRADGVGQDVLGPDLNHAPANGLGGREDGGEVEVVGDHDEAAVAHPRHDHGIGWR